MNVTATAKRKKKIKKMEKKAEKKEKKTLSMRKIINHIDRIIAKTKAPSVEKIINKAVVATRVKMSKNKAGFEKPRFLKLPSCGGYSSMMPYFIAASLLSDDGKTGGGSLSSNDICRAIGATLNYRFGITAGAGKPNDWLKIGHGMTVRRMGDRALALFLTYPTNKKTNA